jgi:tRNA (cmo5U34)-methyltransferase
VLHHLPGEEEKENILKAVAKRLKPKAPLILPGNHHAYSSQPLMLAAWRERWRMYGATAEEVTAKLGKIQQGADPPQSEAAVISLLRGAGFGQTTRFFGSLFWGAWLARRNIRGARWRRPITNRAKRKSGDAKTHQARNPSHAILP